ncbi:hypothetical protein [Celerinatantimonas sp. MCCC 1A17872]|uniref:hypothetical protein n=1 Tax=Celerinatantimonas sp. MCCC 1A17872 TaxID=3177514 RepID=UPI0038C7A28E
MTLDLEKLILLYDENFMELSVKGVFKEFLGIPFGINLNSCKISSCKCFTDFLLPTIKFSRFDEWFVDEKAEEVEYIKKALLFNAPISLDKDSIRLEIESVNRYLEENKIEQIIEIEGFNESLEYGYKFNFNWNHWSMVGVSQNYYLAYHWYTTE